MTSKVRTNIHHLILLNLFILAVQINFLMRQKLPSLLKLVVGILVFTGFGGKVLSSDKIIQGKVNVYRKVLTVNTGSVIVNSVDSIAPGDTVLLIQMQGVGIDTDQGAYGTYVAQKFGEPGGYEFLLVQSVDPGTKTVVFRNNILNTFDTKGNVQLIKVPFYNTATVGGILTAKSWDPVEQTGGVLALIVGRKLTLNAGINVSGKGFYGGSATSGNGTCDPVDLDSHPSAYQNSGFKGEGVAIHDALAVLLNPDHAKGKGANMTGGGGGNGRFSGGGGGSNRGIGEYGGLEKRDLCDANPSDGGRGGFTVRSTQIEDGIFLGGGGGASTHLTGSASTPGGRGGGIVFIIADTISGNQNFIRADGASALNAVADGGGGGGGAGGSVVISLQSFSSVETDILDINANGGNGGSNPGGFGSGGGGGGGLIAVSTSSLPAKVRTGVNYGTPSFTPALMVGELKYDFVAKLNGFLFNSIRSEVTGNQIDSICSNVPFGKITGTIPIGGTSPYIYEWEYSTTSETAGFTPAPGINNQPDYTPGLLSVTTWFRRIVTDAGAPALVDISKPVKVIVQQAITDNLVGKDTILCYNQDPLKLVPLNAGPGAGNGIYSYRWIQNNDNADWDTSPDATGANLAEDYDPPVLTDTTYYVRVVTSGRCIDYSPSVKITVLPVINTNILLTTDQTICYGDQFININASDTPVLNGGDGTFRFKWIGSADGTVWADAAGTISSATYDPVEASSYFPGTEYFSRIVLSGFNDCCADTSNAVLFTSHPVITNNSVSQPQTICSGNSPVLLAGTQPENGNGVNYTFIWQDSSKLHNWMTITSGGNGRDYQPPVLVDTTAYRRIVLSSACDDTSNVVVVAVHKPVTNNTISLLSGSGPDTTICNNSVPARLSGTDPEGGTDVVTDYIFEWQYSANNTDWNPVPSGGTASDYQPGALSATVYYRRKVSSGECSSLSNTINIIVLPDIANNIIPGDTMICYNTAALPLAGAVLSGGAGPGTYSFFWEQSPDGTSWGPASGTGNTETYQPPALTAPMSYRRTVTSGPAGCCISTSNVMTTGINPLPTGQIISVTDTIICEGSQVPLKLHLTGAPSWKMVYSQNSSQVTVDNIRAGDTTILVTPSTTLSYEAFSYSFFSLQDDNGCIATSLTGSRNAEIYKVPVAFAGEDDKICGPEYILKATPTVGTGTWYFPPEVVDATANGPEVTVKIDSSFTSTSVQYKFYWEEVNWQCVNRDSVLITFDRRINSVNAGDDKVLYSFDNLAQVVAEPVREGESGKWTVVTGTGDFDDDTADSTNVRNISKGLNTYLWTITNGECRLEDRVNIEVYDLVVPEGFSPNYDPDNYNNTFIISGLDLRKKWVAPDSVPAYQIADLIIINSAGTEVFSTTNRKGNTWKDWDGKNSKGLDLPEGTYYYLLKLTSVETGKVFKKSGFIVLKRY
jgi:hypothetical protein